MADTQFNDLLDSFRKAHPNKASYEDRLDYLLHFLGECVEEGEMPDIDEPYYALGVQRGTIGEEISKLNDMADEKFHAKHGNYPRDFHPDPFGDGKHS